MIRFGIGFAHYMRREIIEHEIFLRCKRKFEQIVRFVKWQKFHRTIEIRIKRTNSAFAVGAQCALFSVFSKHWLLHFFFAQNDHSTNRNLFECKWFDEVCKAIQRSMNSMRCENARKRANERASICYSSEIFNEVKLFIHASLHIQPHIHSIHSHTAISHMH